MCYFGNSTYTFSAHEGPYETIPTCAPNELSIVCKTAIISAGMDARGTLSFKQVISPLGKSKIGQDKFKT